MGRLGHRVDFDAAHTWAFTVNVIEGMGGVGIVFHACCLLETTTIAFPIRMLPIARVVADTLIRFDLIRLAVRTIPCRFLVEGLFATESQK